MPRTRGQEKRPRQSGAKRSGFERLGHDERTTLYQLLTQAFAETLREGVPRWYADEGPGLVIFLFRGLHPDDLKPPIYLSLPQWQQHKRLLVTPHTDIVAAVASYNPEKQFIVLAVGEWQVYHGRYAWWTIPFTALDRH